LSFVFYNGMFEFFILGLFYVVYRLGSYLLATNNIRIKSPNWLTYILSPLTLIGAVLAVILL